MNRGHGTDCGLYGYISYHNMIFHSNYQYYRKKLLQLLPVDSGVLSHY